MKRSEALAPLSRDHHVALEAALRLRRATPETVDTATTRFATFWRDAGARHFEIEEELLLTALDDGGPRWDEALARVRAEHAEIRARADRLDPGDVDRARELGELLAAHVRFEERTLFELLEGALTEDELAALGRAVARAEAGPGPSSHSPGEPV
jgi:hemerythrin-like domain-containing protein